jgi:predicted dehydrogenase
VISTAAINDLVLPGFARSEPADLVAVASRSDERAQAYAAEHGVPRGYGSYDGLLADDDVEAVYISLPNGLHGEWTRRALEAGKHVLCEKPLTPTADEARDLFALAEEQSLLLMEAFMYRHHPQTHMARDLIRGGEIGDPLIVRSWFHFEVEDPASDVRYQVEQAGGALRDVGCYCVSFSNYLLESGPSKVSAVAHWADSGVDQRFSASMAYESGTLATFDCSIQAPLHIGLTVLGSRGALHIPTPWYPHEPPQRIALHRGDATQQVAAEGEDSYFLEIENFTAAVIGEAEPEVPPGETVRNLETIDRLIAAAAG